jgi:flagellar protein FliS
LNVEQGGAIAAELDRLYAYVTGRLVAVTSDGDIAACDEVHKLFSTLRDGWAELAAAERMKGAS